MEWLIVGVVLAIMIWSFWPSVSRFLHITANEGDELVANITKAKKRVNKKLK